MKKFLSYFLATIFLCAGVATTTSCNFLEDSPLSSSSSPSSSSVEEIIALSFTKKAYAIEDGENVTLQLEFTVNGEDADWSALTFTSSASKVATVSEDGTVTGISNGTAYITAAYKENSVKAKITVTEREYVITLSEEYLLFPVNTTQKVTATAYFGMTELTEESLVWESSDITVATVENGKITGVGSGIAEITVSSQNAFSTLQVSVFTEATEEQVNTFSEEYINVYGRSYISNNQLNLDHAANGVEVGIIGDSLTINMYSLGKSYMRVYVDNSEVGKRIPISAGVNDYTVVSGLEEGYHVVRLVQCTEEQLNARWSIYAFHADGFFAAPEKSKLKIEFIGDSITAGYGSIGKYAQAHSVDNSDAAMTYAYLTAHALRADYSIVAWSGICTKAYHWAKNINMMDLYQRVSYTNSQPYAFDSETDVVVLNLGTNEASYIGLPEGANYGPQFPIDYQEFLELIREKNPNAYIICLYGMCSKRNLINNSIQMAIKNLNDEKIIYNPFEIIGDDNGANYHPNSLAHQKWAGELTAYIRTLF